MHVASSCRWGGDPRRGATMTRPLTLLV